jgi:pyruvate dehydrogenase E1 component
MIGGTAGRTTLNGEGLQHQDGHSHVLFNCVPNCITYDPAWSYEIAVIIQDGIRRMHEVGEDVFYYITVGNENYAQPAMPEGDREGIRQGILKGIYMYRAALSGGKSQVQLWGSGAILNSVVRAQEILHEKYGIQADVWSATSYGELRRDALAVERWNRLNPLEPARKPYVQQVMEQTAEPIISSSDYMKVMADQLSPWLGGRLVSLGTDGFGRSESRENLRRHFEVDAENIVVAALSRLARDGQFDPQRAAAAIKELGLDANARDAARA